MWALLLLAIVPYDPVIRDRATRLETNQYFDENGRLIFTQIIAWDEEHVFVWRMLKEQVQSVQRVNGGYYFPFDDNGIQREIWSLSHSESWTQVDVEVEDRSTLPVEQRRRLRQGRHERHHPPLAPAVPIR